MDEGEQITSHILRARIFPILPPLNTEYYALHVSSIWHPADLLTLDDTAECNCSSYALLPQSYIQQCRVVDTPSHIHGASTMRTLLLLLYDPDYHVNRWLFESIHKHYISMRMRFSLYIRWFHNNMYRRIVNCKISYHLHKSGIECFNPRTIILPYIMRRLIYLH